MFKRTGAIVLTALYLVTVVGFVINLRYCGKVITAVNVNTPVTACKTVPISSKMKCCTEKHIDIQVKDSHQGEFPSFLGKLFSFHIAKLPFAKVAFNIPIAERSSLNAKAPPDDLLAATPVFIRNCTFRI
jgi:hypothetical protein